MPVKSKLAGLVISAEDIFFEVSRTVDFILFKKEDMSQKDINGLWTLLVNDIHDLNPNTDDKTMNLFAGTIFLFAKEIFVHHCENVFREKINDMLSETLENHLGDYYDDKVYKGIIRSLTECSQQLDEWINDYEESDFSLSDEIEDVLSNVDKPEDKKIDFTPTGQTFTKTTKVTDLQLTLIMQRLAKANRLDPNGSADDWLKLFSGVNSMFTIKWLGTPGELRDLFKLLTKPKGKNKTGYVTPLYNYQQIVQSHFTDKNGEAFKPLKGQKSIDSFKPILDDCEFTLQFLTDNMTEVMKEIINNNEGALIEAGLSYNISAAKNDDNLRIRNKR